MIDYEKVERHYYNHCDEKKKCNRNCMFKKSQGGIKYRNCNILKYVPISHCKFYKKGNKDDYDYFLKKTKKEILKYKLKKEGTI